MRGLVRMVALSAIASVGIVAAYSHDKAPAAVASGKVYHDRVLPGGMISGVVLSAEAPEAAAPVVERSRKGDRLAVAPSEGCAARPKATVVVACLTGRETGSNVRRVKTVTLETRNGADLSVLTQAVAAEVAGR